MNEERDSFFDFHGISEEEEKFFKVIYRRRQILLKGCTGAIREKDVV